MGYGDGEMYKTIEIRFIGLWPHHWISWQVTPLLNRDRVKANVPSMAKFIDNDDVFRLMLRKGVYPYEYMDNWQKFEELELPPKEAFHSKLNMKGISDRDHEYAKEVWDDITPEGDNVTMWDYHDIYLTIDVLLLADVFETFRGVCLDNYSLDPAHFYSAPGLAWNAALKFTGIKLELLTDPDRLLMFEKGIRGGIVQAVHRYAKANNKYMGDQHNPNEESSYLQYLDANNLYGCAMRQDLPTDGFKWISNVEAFTERRIGKLVEYNRHGYILEVDIDYPRELHDEHNELPLLPERKMKAWLKGYIDHNTGFRMAAINEFEKDFYKLMNLSVFGNTMENIRNHCNIQLVTNEDKYTKLVMKPNFKGVNWFSKHLLGVEMGKTEVKMNKPVNPKYGSKLQLCYMDTDLFVYHIRTHDFYKDIANDVEARFDTSAYNADDGRPLPMGKNKKVVGLMKDELGGKIMTEFITLRAKAYAYKSLTKKGGDRKAKGVKRCVTKKSITFDDYQRCLEEGIDIYKSQILIQNKGHRVYTKEVLMLALNRADDKRLIQQDQITTLARGHYRLASTGYRRIIKGMSDIAQVFDNASAEYENIEKPIDKRQILKGSLRKGKGHLLPKKCTGFVDKAPEEAINKVHTEYVQHSRRRVRRLRKPYPPMLTAYMPA
ncbi:uncharacterized protein LOC130648092 [Hydractinia symbiolongicarpus]|uniref:uncharacterized protein LOC130648092 n=1 Tax=Hydractinia symbiolongicarpus TaxID=13093 RepID=UPI002551675A|nr:uncharacterized protein LOC130648092 [Hydractinia symbiolongicarpus]